VTISTDALATSTDAVIALVAVLATKIFLVLAATLGLGVGLWFLYKVIRKAKGAVK